MRKTAKLTLMCALPLLAGCDMEEAFENERQTAEQEITIQAVREGDPGETRTALQNDGKTILWTPGDEISLFYGRGSDGGSRFTSTATENNKVTNFTGTIGVITGGAEVKQEDTYFWGLYPYQEDASCDGSTVTMTLPSAQTATPGTFATGLFPSLGRSQGLSMGFYNICGLWWFSVTKEGVRKVTLKGNNGEVISGKARIGFDGSGYPEVKEITEGSDKIVLECPRGEYFEVNKNYYIVMFPTEFSSGFTMTFETYTEEGVYNRTRETTIARNGNRGITGLDSYLTTPYARKTGNIPVEDANFKAYLVSNFDTNGDGEISYEEVQTIKSIDVITDGIQSVQGIEYMENLTSLSVHGSGWNSNNWTEGTVSYIDVSNNKVLDKLKCYINKLTTLDVSKNTALRTLYCYSNQLATLDVSKNTVLGTLDCGSNQLTTLDVSKNTALRTLYCYSNQLATLDVSKNTALTSLDCATNQLTTLDISKNTDLTYLWCGSNQLTTLDVSQNTALKTLGCYSNQLTTIDVSKNTNLTSLNCQSNQLTSLDVSKNTALTSLSCATNQLTTLDISKNTDLTYLWCGSNQLTTLDVSKNTTIIQLECVSNQLTTLDISKNTDLAYLLCYSNQFTTLDVSKNMALTYLDCSPMSTLTTLYIYQGQEIPNVTTDRNVYYIPAATEIKVATPDGGDEDLDDPEEEKP